MNYIRNKMLGNISSNLTVLHVFVRELWKMCGESKIIETCTVITCMKGACVTCVWRDSNHLNIAHSPPYSHPNAIQIKESSFWFLHELDWFSPLEGRGIQARQTCFSALTQNNILEIDTLA